MDNMTMTMHFVGFHKLAMCKFMKFFWVMEFFLVYCWNTSPAIPENILKMLIDRQYIGHLRVILFSKISSLTSSFSVISMPASSIRLIFALPSGWTLSGFNAKL